MKRRERKVNVCVKETVPADISCFHGQNLAIAKNKKKKEKKKKEIAAGDKIRVITNIK